MTLAPLDFTFPLRSDLSRRHPWEPSRDELIEEAADAIAERRAFYAAMVEGGKMSGADADRHNALLEAIARELPFGADADRAFAWDAKVRELRRELAIRRRAWPRRLSGESRPPLDPAVAARRMERLDALHYLYWIRLHAFDTELARCSRFEEGRRLFRAHMWRVWNWEREAAARGETIEPSSAAWFAQLDAGDVCQTALWNVYRRAAEQLGFAPRQEEKAA